MKKKTGFTLIELLAVIVILAIIALIAVPVIMNIISKARKSAFEDTAYGLISAGEMYYADKLLDAQGMTQDVEFEIENGSFKGENKLNVSGSLPTNGKITVTKDGKVAIAVDNGAYCITKMTTESGITTNEKNGDCDYKKVANPLFTINDFATSIDVCTTNGQECQPGTKFAVQVNATEKKNFYVVEDENNIVTLLMDSNLGSGVEWIIKDNYTGTEAEWDVECDDCGNNNKGPLTALKELEDRTKEWTNLPKGYTTIDDNTTALYSPITRSNARARLIKKTEINDLGCKDYESSSSCPTWAYSSDYWTSSANADFSHETWYVASDLDYVTTISLYSTNGLRPVIEISKSNI